MKLHLLCAFVCFFTLNKMSGFLTDLILFTGQTYEKLLILLMSAYILHVSTYELTSWPLGFDNYACWLFFFSIQNDNLTVVVCALCHIFSNFFVDFTVFKRSSKVLLIYFFTFFRFFPI